jgi:DNA-directed RNA polymerase subunit F
MKVTAISEEPISIYDLKKTLADIKQRDGELGFRGTKTEEYLINFAKLDAKKVEDLKKKLEELNIPRLKQEHICKLADVLPGDVEDIKLVLASYSVTITNENLAKIADVIKDHRK